MLIPDPHDLSADRSEFNAPFHLYFKTVASALDSPDEIRARSFCLGVLGLFVGVFCLVLCGLALSVSWLVSSHPI